MDPLAVSNFVAFCAQVACVGIVAAVAPAILRIDVAALRFTYWRAALAICLVLPFLPARHVPGRVGNVRTGTVVTSGGAASADAPAVGQSLATPVEWAGMLVTLIAIGVTLRALWLAIGFLRIRHLSSMGVDAPEHDHRDLQQRLGTDAVVRYASPLQQPVTFGLRPPIVLLPESLRDAPLGIRDAVLAHELIHVRRRDWPWVIAEEVVRAVVWFHPVLWWLISRVQLAREELVDVEAISVTGSRKTYVEALLTFADGPVLSPAPGFARRRHLFHRIVWISKEGVMSGRRVVLSLIVTAGMVIGGAWYATAAFPIVEATQPAALLTAPGPLEQTAAPVTPENPIPRRIYSPQAAAPVEVVTAKALMHVTLRTVIDQNGRVAELRLAHLSLKAPAITLEFNDPVMSRLYEALAEVVQKAGNVNLRPMVDASIAAAATAVQASQYDRPFQAPIAFDTVVSFGPDGQSQTAIAPAGNKLVRPGVTADGALRVGGNVKVPTKIRHVDPVYPPDAMASKTQGVVILEARLEPDGTVGEVKVLRSIPALDQAAIDAVKQWQFEPTLLNGKPTPVIFTMTVQFKMQ